MSDAVSRRLLTAELLSIGSELTVGETRDTNAGEIARSLTGLGVRVTRLTALPDDLVAVTDAFAAALERSDLVISTGGLGPTPDDLTREAIAAVCDETPEPDPDLEAWLRELWRRRDMPFPELNLKQAWLIGSAVSLPNPNGTAPGWFVGRPDGRVIVALPGPPREMRPMWADEAVPRLQALGLGAPVATPDVPAGRDRRVPGRRAARRGDAPGDQSDRRHVRPGRGGRRPDLGRRGRDDVGRGARRSGGRASSRSKLGGYVWATGETTWSDAIGARLVELGWTLAVVEIGTGGSIAALFGDAAWLRFDESIAAEAPAATAHESAHGSDHGPAPGAPDAADEAATDDLIRYARRARELGGADVGLAVRTRSRSGDMAVSIAVVAPSGERHVRRVVFLAGGMGRSRAALAAAAVLLEALGETPA